MTIPFDNILIPVDFSVNTEIAVKKAITLIGQQKANIHLLHVLPSFLPKTKALAIFFDGKFRTKAKQNIAERKLEQWKQSIVETVPGTSVHIHLVVGGNVQQAVVNHAIQLRPQLLVIGKQRYHAWVSFLNTITPGKVAAVINCPVLTAKLGSLNNRIKTIVFPVQSNVPTRKLDVLITLAKRFRARVYLVVLENRSKNTATPLYNAFIETHRLLKSALNTPIDHMIISGTDLTKGALAFAESIYADMILVDPTPKSKIPFFHRETGDDMVKPNSRLEILSVQ